MAFWPHFGHTTSDWLPQSHSDFPLWHTQRANLATISLTDERGFGLRHKDLQFWALRPSSNLWWFQLQPAGVGAFPCLAFSRLALSTSDMPWRFAMALTSKMFLHSSIAVSIGIAEAPVSFHMAKTPRDQLRIRRASGFKPNILAAGMNMILSRLLVLYRNIFLKQTKPL